MIGVEQETDGEPSNEPGTTKTNVAVRDQGRKVFTTKSRKQHLPFSLGTGKRCTETIGNPVETFPSQHGGAEKLPKEDMQSSQLEFETLK